MEYLSSTEVAKLLKVSIDKIKILEKQGILHRAKREGQKDYYFSKEIAQIKPHHELTITELASLSEIEIQNKTVSLISSFRKIFIITGCLLSGYIVLIVIFAILFIIIPVQTARWLGIVKTRVSASLTQATINKQVLGVATNLAQSNNSSSIQAILQPVGIVALGLVKNINPESYTQISKVAILDMNDVLALNSSNAMTPVVPLKVSNTSLEVTNSGLIQNLNSQYLQGKKPGTNVGDIAVLGNNGGIEGLSTAANGVKQTTNFDSTTLNGLINTNPLGSAGIINTNLVNSAVTITTASPLSGGGTVSLGGTLDLNCPTCNSIVDLTSKVSNVLPLANGGTGAISFATNGILYGNGTSAIQALTPGTSGYILQSNGADSSPSWTAVSELSVGNVPFSGITTGTNTSAIMTIGTGGTLQYSGTGILNANQLLGSTWKAPGTIGATTANTGTFTTLLVTSINGLTITNNGTNTLTIAAGKTLTANNSLTFVGTDGTIFTLPSASDTLVGRTSTDILTNKTIAAGSNTITGLTATNLIAGDYSSKVTSGTYSINISGNATTATTATNLSGSLVGDVSGTQTTTSVDKIKGVTLGTTTATSGNLLIGNGTQWVTQALSNDATLSSAGVLTLKNTGTAGTYGSALNIPVVTTDTQGRVTSVTNTAIAGLTISNFSSANISQWINNSGYITASTTDILTNKTIAAGSNTITGLTNSNLSGAAGIVNANLANSAVTINTTGPLSGGSAVSLGGSVTLTCSTCITSGGTLFTAAASGGSNSTISQGGTLTFTAGSNITTTNNGTGTVTIGTLATPSFTSINGLTITNNGTNTLTIAAGKTLTANNSLTFVGTDGTIFTLPSASDTLVGRTSTDILTNKTITAPAINGTVTTTGLTLPAFTASGNITGSGLPTLSSFGTINGLTFSSVSDGFTIAGGTTSRIMTVTGADITIGNTIKPSSSGGLTVQSNGVNALTLDAGGASTVNVGITNATTLLIGNFSASTSITGSKWAVTSSGSETLSPTTSATTALTVNGTTNTTPADAVDINLLHTGGTATNGLLVNMNGSGGTTINGVTVTQSIGTLSNGVSLSGTISNALNFVGTSFTKLINAPNFNVTNGGVVTGGTYNGITIGSIIQPSVAGNIALQSNGANTVTIDTGLAGATINLGNTNASAIALGNGTQNTTLTLTGTGLTTLGGNLTFSGSAARTITGPNTGAAGALVLTTNGNISGLTLNTANATSGNSGSVSLTTGTVTTSGTSGNVTINTGSSNTTTLNTGGIIIQSGTITTSGTSGNVALEVGTGGTLGTIQLGVATAAPISIGTATTAGKTITIGEITNPSTQINLNSGVGYTINGSTGVHSLKGGATADITTLVSSAGTGLTILPSAPSATNPGTVVTLQGGSATNTGNGGGVTITGGLGVGALGNGGGLTLTGGTAGTTTATGGTIALTTGAGGTVSGASGGLIIQTGATTSGNSGTITIDTGVGTGGTNGTIIIGTSNASALTIGRSGITTSINGTAAVTSLTIGGGTKILKHLSGTNTFSSPGIGQSACSNIGTVTVTGAAVGDSVIASPTAVSGGIETTLLAWNAYVSSANTVTIRACSVGGLLSTQTPANQTWRVDVWQH